MGDAPNEPGQILVLLNVGAIFMGTALTIRDLIGERAIFLREQAVGLSTSAYLLAKVCVYTVFAIVQSAIVTAITLIGKGGPTQGAVALGKPGALELFVDVAATTVASAMLGLALSALAQVQRADHAAARRGGHVAAGVLRRHDSGHRPRSARPDVVGYTGAVGLRGVSLHRRSDQAGARSARSRRTHTGSTPRRRGGSTSACLFVISVVYLGFVRWKIRLRGG